MGRTRTTVGTAISRVIEDKVLPNSVKQAAIATFIQGKDLAEEMQANLSQGIAAKAQRMYDYARKGHYTHGLPSGGIYTPAETGEAEVRAVLASIEGQEVLLDYLHHAPANNLHFGWIRLVADHGYDTATNQLGGLSTSMGVPVFLEDMVVVIPASQASTTEAKSLQQWGLAAKSGPTPSRPANTTAARRLVNPSPVELDAEATGEYLRVSYIWGTPEAPERGSFQIPVTGLNEQADYFHACYVAGGVRKYWMYEDGAGTHVGLDAVFDSPPMPNGSFFPFVYFRYEKTSALADKTTDSYKTSKRLLKYLNMDFDEVTEAIHQNPDIIDVEQAMLMMAVPGNTENEIERRYLFDFFDALYQGHATGNAPKQPTMDLFIKPGLVITGFTHPGIAIQDGRFKLWLENNGLYKRRVVGNIGKIGRHDSGFVAAPSEQKVLDPVSGEEVTITTPGKHHYYRRQVSSAFYDEILVVEQRTVFNIFGSYSTIGDEEDDILLIPVDRAIAGRYSLPKREELYSRSMHYVFNSRVVTKLKWYQTSLFRAILIIVMIVVTILTQGATAKELFALIAAGAYTAAAYLLAVTILTHLLYSLAFKAIVKAVGAEAAFLLAVIAAIGGFSGAFETTSLAGVPFAEELLIIANGLTSAIARQSQASMRGLASEYEALDLLNKEREKLLKDGEKLLGESIALSPYTIFGETPQQYFGRTIHSGNIGAASIEAVSRYVDTRLALPTFAETIGGLDE